MEDIQQMPDEDGKIFLQRVVYLDRGDNVYLQFPAQMIQYVSKERDAHVLGLFEI